MLAAIFSIRNPSFVLRRVREVGPPIVYEPGHSPFHAGLCGLHEIFVSGEHTHKQSKTLCHASEPWNCAQRMPVTVMPRAQNVTPFLEFQLIIGLLPNSMSH